MTRFKNIKKDQEGKGKVMMIAIVAVIAIVIGAFVIYPAIKGDDTTGGQMFGVAIMDADTGKTVSGEVSMEQMNIGQQLMSFGQSRTVTLPAMYSAEEMAAFSSDVTGIVLNKNYIIIPYIVMDAVTDSPSLYAATGTAYVQFTGTTTPSQAVFDMVGGSNAKTITSPTKTVTMNANPVGVNMPNDPASVRFINVMSATPGDIAPLKGAYLDHSVIKAKVSATFVGQGAIPETTTSTADLTIHLINPLSGVFQISISNMAAGAL
jgi:hypothetical protein